MTIALDPLSFEKFQREIDIHFPDITQPCNHARTAKSLGAQAISACSQFKYIVYKQFHRVDARQITNAGAFRADGQQHVVHAPYIRNRIPKATGHA
jgi:hypothetical protein